MYIHIKKKENRSKNLILHERISNTKIPITVTEAVNHLMIVFSEGFNEELKNTKYEDLINYHFSFGMCISNEFWLWNRNYTLLKDSGYENMHPDEASMIIIEAFWKRLNEK